MTTEEIKKELENRELETYQYCYLSDRNNHLHVIVWNQLTIMKTLSHLLTKLEEK